jgi:hypothetical protein
MTRSLSVLPKEITSPVLHEWTQEAVAAFIAALLRAAESSK